MTIPLSIENVIMEGVRRIDEWSRIRDRIPTLDVIVRFADQPAERAKGVNLTPDEWRVFARINGADNIATIARLTRLSDFDVCRIIYGFIQAGLVEVGRASRRPAQAQARARALVAGGVARRSGRGCRAAPAPGPPTGPPAVATAGPVPAAVGPPPAPSGGGPRRRMRAAPAPANDRPECIERIRRIVARPRCCGRLC